MYKNFNITKSFDIETFISDLFLEWQIREKKKIYARFAAISNISDSPINSDFDNLELNNEITNHYSKVLKKRVTN